jgi:peptidoglycan hydrolase-like protein with peptidoglycan-binding domain
MKQFVVMLGISLLLASGFLPLHAEARGATSRLVELRDQDLVRDVQRQLKAQGFYPGAVDGNFGSQTATALRAYQRSYRLPATGRLDETTLRSLLPERSEVSGAPEVSRAPVDLSNREVLRDAQRQLKALGFDPGSTDGTFGPQTEAALRAYQQSYRLPETGRLDDATLRSLLPERRQGALR